MPSAHAIRNVAAKAAASANVALETTLAIDKFLTSRRSDTCCGVQDHPRPNCEDELVANPFVQELRNSCHSHNGKLVLSLNDFLPCLCMPNQFCQAHPHIRHQHLHGCSDLARHMNMAVAANEQIGIQINGNYIGKSHRGFVLISRVIEVANANAPRRADAPIPDAASCLPLQRGGSAGAVALKLCC